MKNRLFAGCALVCLGGAALLINPIVHAQDQSTPAPSTRPVGQRPPRGGGPGNAMNLEGAMKSMGQAFKQLHAQVKDPSANASSLNLVLQMEQSTVAAKSQPPRLPRASDEDRTK